MIFSDLTIVTSCINYGKYLADWSRSIIGQSVKPGRVCIFTHGSQKDYRQAEAAMMQLIGAGISCYHAHSPEVCDFGVARNRAVELAETTWVMHLDADDLLSPNAIVELMRVAPTADVVQAAYERMDCGHCNGKVRKYEGADGLNALSLTSIASGNSMFKRSLWEQRPYRTDLLGAWDTALWLGFAYLGARFRPAQQTIFKYRQHADSIFNKRRATMGWTRVHTTAMLKAVRRNYSGVAVIVPRDLRPSAERQRNWERVQRFYRQNFPTWELVEGFCPTVTWVKGAAIADALTRTNAETLVIADADVLVDPIALMESVAAVQQGGAWSMPHANVYRSDASTAEFMCQMDDVLVPTSLDRGVYEGVPGGGIIILKHVMYDAIGGMPLAFRGWGSEDKCLAFLCEKLVGPCVRGSADLIHLWHPPQPGVGVANQNVKLLQVLAQAAQKGRDSLVQAVHALPKPTAGTYQAAARTRRVAPVNTSAIAQRMEQRRMP